MLWFTGLLNRQNGRFDAAIANFEQIVEGGFEQARGRGFDFSQDWRVLNELGGTLYQRARQERGEARRDERESLLAEAIGWLEKTLEMDPENLEAHYTLERIYADLGDEQRSAEHAAEHRKYKPDDNAADQAVALARNMYSSGERRSGERRDLRAAFATEGRLNMKDDARGAEPEQDEDDEIIGVAFRWSLMVIAGLGAVAAAIAIARMDDEPEERVVDKDVGEIEDEVVDVETLPDVAFTEVTEAAGIDFVHESGARGRKFLPETMGGGVAFLDYDGDGDQDLLFVNGREWPASGAGGADAPSRSGESALQERRHGFLRGRDDGSRNRRRPLWDGVAVGDADGDGAVDVVITGVGGNRMYRNAGDGTFVDVTAASGVAARQAIGRRAPGSSTWRGTATWICSCVTTSSGRARSTRISRIRSTATTAHTVRRRTTRARSRRST